MGIFGQDNSIKDGKNLLNFMLIYLVGYEIKTNVIFKKIKLTNIVVYFISYNVLFCLLYYYTFGTKISALLIKIGFGYNSPLLLINAVMFFMLFTKIRIHSRIICGLASSVFSIYLIHSNRYVESILWPKIDMVTEVCWLWYVVVDLFIMGICIFIDKLLKVTTQHPYGHE